MNSEVLEVDGIFNGCDEFALFTRDKKYVREEKHQNLESEGEREREREREGGRRERAVKDSIPL